MALPNNVFLGRINGQNPSELHKKINYSKTKLEDRKQIVDDILATGFYDEYFESYFKVNINSGDILSDKDNVCNSLETLANYLLNSEEIKEEKKDDEYIFYSDEHAFNKAIQKEANIEGMGNTDDKDNIIHFLRREKRNYKSPKTQRINKKDLTREDFLGEVLKSYKLYLDNVTTELKNFEDSKLSRYKLSQIVGNIKQDMIQSKDMLLGVFGYKTNAEESTKIDWDLCDLTNPEHVKALLYMKPGFRNDEDLMYLIDDFVNKLDMAKPTKLQKEIVLLMRQNKGQTEIGEALNISKQRVQKNINALTDRICKITKAIEFSDRT